MLTGDLSHSKPLFRKKRRSLHAVCFRSLIAVWCAISDQYSRVKGWTLRQIENLSPASRKILLTDMHITRAVKCLTKTTRKNCDLRISSRR